MGKPILCLDFDGVIHSYTSPWAGPTIIADRPVEGALAFIQDAQQHFTVAIYSSRSETEEGRMAMEKWLWAEWLIHFGLSLGNTVAFRDIQWPTTKPPAFLTIDDRAIRFEGPPWPLPQDLLSFKPWNK